MMSRQEIGASFHSSIQSPSHHQTPEEAIRETKTWMACEEDNDDTYTDGSNTFNRKEDRMVFLFLSYTSRMSEGLFRSAMEL